ncbi:MAG: DUF4112 domain-containing protein [Bacteroidetes bacterium]|jgi:hypothetical protein|nr:DUF4112 domain-containing protein [Bacteroidota bacterium]
MSQPKEFPALERLADFLDTRYRIPGTNIRFGADFLIGLVPYAGDVVAFGISSVLVLAMARQGASGMVLAKMIGNVLLDASVGSIPILGDLFDLGYKANRRNLKLLEEHYEEGKHQGSAWWVVALVLLILLALIGLSVWVVVWILGAASDLLFS